MFSFTDHEHKKHFCMHCLQCCYSNDDLEKHQKDCISINGVQATELPQPKIDRVYFQNYHKMLHRPFVIIADFECNTEKINTPETSDEKINSSDPSDEKSYTE